MGRKLRIVSANANIFLIPCRAQLFSDGAKKRDMGSASAVSRVIADDGPGSLSSSKGYRIVEERLTDAISSKPKADYTKVLIGAAFNTARRAET
ncbi:UNVERIFIED_ORG: putative RNase H-like nuclease [Shinella zoogloeoides]|nr:putative RNase H-like nuclease [Shinella zoogloeoides]